MDEVVAYQQTVGGIVGRYYPHYNHLYSVAALTDSSGAVVERYTYDAYGRQTITSAGGVSRSKSAVGWDRGFTGYIADFETGLLHARARQYSPTLGRFVSRDPMKYIDGMGLYGAYFVPNALDPSGKMTCFFCYKWDPKAPGWFGCPGACVLDTEKVNEHKKKYEACVAKSYQDFRDRQRDHDQSYRDRLDAIGRAENDAIAECDREADRKYPNASGADALAKVAFIYGCKAGARSAAGALEKAADIAHMAANEGNEVKLALDLLGCNEGTGCRWFAD